MSGIYFTKKQKKVLNLFLDKVDKLILDSGLSDKDDLEDIRETIMEIRAKVNGKKLSKNGVFFAPVEIDCLNDDKLIVRPRKDGRAIILESKNRVSSRGYYSFPLGRENAIILTNEIIKYLNAWGIDYTPEDKNYNEEIHVYADGVERSIDIGGGEVSFICYTDDENDNHWTFLTPSKAKYFVELMLGYIHSTERGVVS